MTSGDIPSINSSGEPLRARWSRTVICLWDLANKWLKGLTTVEQVKDAIVLEQLLAYTLGPSVRVGKRAEAIDSFGDRTTGG